MRRLGLVILAATTLAWGGASTLWAQQQTRPGDSVNDVTLHAGDDAPSLEIEKWLLGSGQEKLTPGRTSIVVFVASWSEASQRALDWMSRRSGAYADAGIDVVAVFGQDVSESTVLGRPETEATARAFIARRPAGKVRYAFDKRWRSRTSWVVAAGLDTLPAAFIVDRNAKVAWIGNPLWPPGEMDDAVMQVAKGAFGEAERRETREKWEGVLHELRQLDNVLTRARNTGQHDKAIETLERLEAIDRLSRAYYLQARFEIVYLEKRDAERAFAIARGVLENDRDDAQLLNDLSWTILTTDDAPARDMALAQKLAERAVEASESKNPHYLDTLARAKADQGRLDDAIKLQKQAVELATDPNEREDMTSTLQEYTRKRGG